MANNVNLENFDNLKFRKEVWEQGILEAYRENALTEMITLKPSSVEGKCAVFHVANHGVGLKNYEGSVVADEVVEPSRIELFYDHKRYWAKAIDDVIKVQMAADLMLPEVNAIAYEIKKELETEVFKLAKADAKNEVIGTSEEDLYDVIVNMGVKLDEENVPQEGRYVIVSPATMAKLQKDTRVLEYHGAPIMANGISQIEVDGMTVVKSNNAEIGNNIICIQRDAIALGVQIDKMESYRSQNSFADVVRGLIVYGLVTVRKENIVKGSIIQEGPTGPTGK